MIKEMTKMNEALKFICDTYFATICNEDSIIGQNNFVKHYVYGDETVKSFNNEEKYYGYYIDELVGVISLRNDGYIKFLFIDKNYQKKGIGKQLIAYVTKQAIDNDIKYLTLDSSLSNVSFYERLGFIKTSNSICIDDIWFVPMQKQIKF